MKNLFRNLKYILERIEESKRILLFLDYDGTLTPIVGDPKKALLPAGTRAVIKRLIKDRRFIVSVVSGRSLRNIKSMIGLNGIYYAGNHGLQMQSPGGAVVSNDRGKSPRLMKSLKARLRRRLSCIKSARFEDKGIIIAVHYRGLTGDSVRRLRSIFYSVVGPYVAKGEIKVCRGKKVLEIRPPQKYDKASYCLYLLKRVSKGKRPPLPIYIGDDKTDEYAFCALKKKGLTIFVKGERKSSCADYYVDSPKETAKFLRSLPVR